MVNRYFNRRPYEGSFYTPPVDLIAQQLDYTQRKYDENYLLANEIKSHFIDSLPQDRRAANELQSAYSRRIDDIVKQYNGDYARASKDLNSFMYDLKKDYNPGGKAFAIASRKNKWDSWLQRQQERVGKDLTGEQLNSAYKYYWDKITPIGEKDPITGAYSDIDVRDLSSYSDANQIYQDVFSKLKPSKVKVGRTIPNKNGYDEYVETEREGFLSSDLEGHFGQALANDPKFLAYIKERAMFEGLSPEETTTLLSESVSQAAKMYAYQNSSDVSKLEPNKFALENLRAGNDRANMKYKHDLENPQPASPQYQWEPAINQLSRKPFTIDKVNWRNEVYLEPNTIPLAGANGVMVAPTRLRKRQFSGTLFEYIHSPEAAKKGIDPVLAEDILKDMKKQQGINGVYYSKSFEADFWDTYQKAHEDNATQQGISRPIPEPAWDNVAKSSVRSLLSGNGTFYKPGSDEYISNMHKEVSEDELVDDKGNPRKDLNIRRVEVGPGFRAAGTLITTNKGNSFVIVDQDTERQSLSNSLSAGLNPLFNGTSRVGKPIPIGEDESGKLIYGTPFIKHRNEGSKTYKKTLYVKTEDGSVYQTSLKQIYDRITPISDKSLGVGASKSDLTPFKFN